MSASKKEELLKFHPSSAGNSAAWTGGKTARIRWSQLQYVCASLGAGNADSDIGIQWSRIWSDINAASAASWPRHPYMPVQGLATRRTRRIPVKNLRVPHNEWRSVMVIWLPRRRKYVGWPTGRGEMLSNIGVEAHPCLWFSHSASRALNASRSQGGSRWRVSDFPSSLLLSTSTSSMQCITHRHRPLHPPQSPPLAEDCLPGWFAL